VFVYPHGFALFLPLPGVEADVDVWRAPPVGADGSLVLSSKPCKGEKCASGAVRPLALTDHVFSSSNAATTCTCGAVR
jgi:hypothetical protein